MSRCSLAERQIPQPSHSHISSRSVAIYSKASQRKIEKLEWKNSEGPSSWRCEERKLNSLKLRLFFCGHQSDFLLFLNYLSHSCQLLFCLLRCFLWFWFLPQQADEWEWVAAAQDFRKVTSNQTELHFWVKNPEKTNRSCFQNKIIHIDDFGVFLDRMSNVFVKKTFQLLLSSIWAKICILRFLTKMMKYFWVYGCDWDYQGNINDFSVDKTGLRSVLNISELLQSDAVTLQQQVFSWFSSNYNCPSGINIVFSSNPWCFNQDLITAKH